MYTAAVTLARENTVNQAALQLENMFKTNKHVYNFICDAVLFLSFWLPCCASSPRTTRRISLHLDA